MPSAELWSWMWTIGGPFIGACIALYLFYTNRIYTKQSYDAMVAQKDKEIEEVEKRYQEAWGIVKTNLIITEQVLKRAEDEVRRR